MKDKIIIVILGILLGLLVGYIFFGSSVSEMVHEKHEDHLAEEKDHDTHGGKHEKYEHMDAHHEHTLSEVDSNLPIPNVSLTAIPDPKGGYNL